MSISSYVTDEKDSVTTQDRESALLQRAIEGDAKAFGVLYERHMLEIYRYIYYRIGHVQDAEDMTEVVFLKVWESLPSFQPGRASFRTWLYRVAKNSLIDRYRTQKQVEGLPDYGLQSPAGTPEQSLAQQQDLDDLTPALQKLAPDYQEVLTLRFINELSHAETARIMERSEGAVRVLQHRALKALKEEFQNAPT